MRAWIAAFTAATVLGACATPQDLAIRDYCIGQSFEKYPFTLVTVIEPQLVRVGTKVTGSKRVCRTEVSDDKKTRTQTCTDEDITEGIYEMQDVPVKMDPNAKARKALDSTCRTDARRQGLFQELNKK